MWFTVPSALWVAGNVMFEAVLFYLQGVVEGSIQFLYCHLDGTLQEIIIYVNKVLVFTSTNMFRCYQNCSYFKKLRETEAGNKHCGIRLKFICK